MTQNYLVATTAIGDLADRLWKDERWAWSQLDHPNWNVQYFSLVALCEAWELSNDEIFSICRSLLANDPCEKLAINLVGKLGSSYLGSFDSEVSNFLAEIVCDKCQPNSVRLEAFFRLEDVNTTENTFKSSQDTSISDVKTKAELIQFRINCLSSKSLEPVDWKFVQQYLSSRLNYKGKNKPPPTLASLGSDRCYFFEARFNNSMSHVGKII